jgi:L-lysine exporter family protein LysE/ArgO
VLYPPPVCHGHRKEGTLEPALEGFALGFGLILAIGAQNAYVLRQGLKCRHVLLIASICALSDALLIGAGVMGLGALIGQAPELVWWVTLGGAVFLFVYGALALGRALRPGRLLPAGGGETSWRAAAAATLAFTFLNPHVYLDTVVLLGGIAARHDAEGRLLFWLGGAAASAVFFYGLGFGARLLAPLFARAAAWRVFDIVIGLVMWAIAASLASDL